MNKRLFIADDEADFRGVVRRVGESLGWNVTECGDGRELITALQNSPDPGLVFLDIMMPEMDGIETVGKLAELTDNRPIYFITGGPSVYSMAARLISDGLSVNVADVLIKPVPLNEIADLLRHHSADAPV